MFWRTKTAESDFNGLDEGLSKFATTLRSKAEQRCTVGIVLGSGLGSLADCIEDRTVIDYRSIPGFPQPTAIGHVGRLVLGKWNNVDVAMMQGRFHLYEGHNPGTTLLPIQLLYALGIRTLILTNASGGMNPHFEAGDLMVLEDHINLMPLFSNTNSKISGPIYDSVLINAAKKIGTDHQLRLRSGIYVGVTGPNYETPAEYRMYRMLGGDTVGMSTVLEASFARQLGIRVCGVSVITNVYRPDVQHETTGEEVVDVATSAANRMSKLLSELLLRGG